MIRNYLEFINESSELILESNVIYSEKFKMILNKINSKLSKELLGIENTDIPVRSNYVDLTKDNDKVSFIPDLKAQEILGTIEKKCRFIGEDGGWLKHSDANKSFFDKLGYVPEGTAPYIPSNMDVGEEVSRITSETSGKTYVYVQFERGKGVYNINKLSFNNTAIKKLWNEFRQEIRIGRIARALLQTANINFTTKEVEDFVNSFKAAIDRMNNVFSKFDVVSGDKIAYWYDSRNYWNRLGTLGSSCMSQVDSSYFNIYVQNPEVCSLIILKSEPNDAKIVGRALLWTLADGEKFMDRIYTINDSDVKLFKDFAKENGWYVKSMNNSGCSEYAISPTDGSVVPLNMTVNIRKIRYGFYPYVDTVKYFDPREGTLSITHSEYLLETTSGGIVCPYCDGEGEGYDGDDDDCENCDGTGYIYY